MTAENSIDIVILGIGAIGPGFTIWPELQTILKEGFPLADIKTQLPSPEILPPAERRRASSIVKAGLNVGLEACKDAGLDPRELLTVFTSSGADGVNCEAICEQLASDDRLISPTRFHNSVHNTVAGYWGIATGCMQPSQVISAEDGSFAAGLLEAAIQANHSGEPCLLVCYDTSYPGALNQVRPISDTAAIALIVAKPGEPKGKYPAIQMSLGNTENNEIRPVTIPTLHALPLLNSITHGSTDLVSICFQDNCVLSTKITP